jgi:hypothetical protein
VRTGGQGHRYEWIRGMIPQSFAGPS